jgi:hypothetical protein
MTLEEETEESTLRDQKTGEENQEVPDELWENCKGQCGTTPWCRDCQLEKEKMHEERLNRQGRSDDKKE